MSVRLGHCADLTDVTLAEEDTNSILTGDVEGQFIGKVAMKVAPPGTWWPKLQQMQVPRRHLMARLTTRILPETQRTQAIEI